MFLVLKDIYYVLGFKLSLGDGHRHNNNGLDKEGFLIEGGMAILYVVTFDHIGGTSKKTTFSHFF